MSTADLGWRGEAGYESQSSPSSCLRAYYIVTRFQFQVRIPPAVYSIFRNLNLNGVATKKKQVHITKMMKMPPPYGNGRKDETVSFVSGEEMSIINIRKGMG